jgi:iron-sulfur cluster assembly protein
LSADDLAAEAALASTLQTDQSPTAAREKQRQQKEVTHLAESMTTTAAPRGFDRLLSAGFTASEVSALRSQFLALQSVSHTPDTMPSGAELRELEDRWMDEGSEATGGGAGAAGGGAFAGGEDDRGSHGALDDMLWGAVMGFFWPIGCVMWLRREEGVWSWRKGLAVFVGVVVNVAFGAMRVMN